MYKIYVSALKTCTRTVRPPFLVKYTAAAATAAAAKFAKWRSNGDRARRGEGGSSVDGSPHITHITYLFSSCSAVQDHLFRIAFRWEPSIWEMPHSHCILLGGNSHIYRRLPGPGIAHRTYKSNKCINGRISAIHSVFFCAFHSM